MQSQTVQMHQSAEESYNYHHFHRMTLARDAKLAMAPKGPLPGEEAPDFQLEDTRGKPWSLSELRGTPVVLIFGSGTCPMTTGSLPGLKKLHREFAHETQWLLLYVREAHPGEQMPAHETLEQKRAQAERMRRQEGVDWPVLIGELDGRTHKAYSELPNHLFLIDREGRVAFRSEFAHAPSLYEALQKLRAQDWRGVVPEGMDKTVHMFGATAYGWRGPRRGGRVALNDLIKGAPPLAANLWMGKMMRPLLAPIAGRSRPLPTGAKVAMAAGALGLVMLALRGQRH
jgi:hypothetical protein